MITREYIKGYDQAIIDVNNKLTELNLKNNKDIDNLNILNIKNKIVLLSIKNLLNMLINIFESYKK